MVSRAIEQHSQLKQNLIRILNDIYPEIHSSLLDHFAEDLANLASENQSSDGLGIVRYGRQTTFC